MNFNSVFKDHYLVNYKIQVVLVKSGLVNDVIENLQHGSGGAVHSDNGVVLVDCKLHLIFQSLDTQSKLVYHLGVGLLDYLRTVGVFHNIPRLLSGEHFHFRLCVLYLPLYHVNGGLTAFRFKLFFSNGLLQTVDHLCGVVTHLFDIAFQQTVQHINSGMVRGTAFCSSLVVGSAGVGRSKIVTAHCEHG